MSFDVATLSRAGGRPVNEDDADVLQVEGATCWVVADGLGGHHGGEEASRAAVAGALASFRERPEISTDALRAHILKAHEAILEHQRADPRLAQMRSTIVVLAASDRAAVWGHIGDTRLYYLQDGRIAERTRDHSVSQALVDAGEVDARDQGQHEDRSRLLRCLGKDASVEPTVHETQALSRGDDFLLCTDGFWELLSDAEIEIDACGAGDASAWLARLEARLIRTESGPQDNYTASAIRVTTPDLPDPPLADPIAIAAHEPLPRTRATTSADAAPRSEPAPVTRRRRTRTLLPLALIVAALLLGVLSWRGPDLVAGARTWFGTPAAPAAPDVRGPAEPAGRAIDAPALPAIAAPEVVTPPAGNAPPLTGSGTPVLATPAAAPVDTPAAVTPDHAYRPAAATSYRSLDAAIAAASEDEEIWIGPGTMRGAVAPMTKTVHLKGAGRDRSHLDFSGAHGLEITAGRGRVEDLDLCCATTSPVLILRGSFSGTIARTRIHKGRDYGVTITDTASPDLVGNDVRDNLKGQIDVSRPATPRIR